MCRKISLRIEFVCSYLVILFDIGALFVLILSIRLQKENQKNIRLIKLRFSRMMLYVSGILAVSATWKLPAIQKLEMLEYLFKLTPIERFRRISSNKNPEILKLYAEFLQALNDDKIRTRLDKSDSENDEIFKELTEKTQYFRDDIYDLLFSLSKKSNPLVRATLL